MGRVLQTQYYSDHLLDLMLLGATIPNQSRLDCQGRVIENRQTIPSRGNKDDAARLAQLQRALEVNSMERFLYRANGWLQAPYYIFELVAYRQQPFRKGLPRRRPDRRVLDQLAVRALCVNDTIPGRVAAGVYTDNSDRAGAGVRISS
jgi:hypothetical protein